MPFGDEDSKWVNERERYRDFGIYFSRKKI